MVSIDRKRRAQQQRRKDFGPSGEGKYIVAAGPGTDTPKQDEVNRLIRLYGLGRAGHSHFSPSSSAGWLNCRGFVLANAGKPDVAGEDAAYGTVAHGVAAVWLTAIRDEGRKAAEHVPKRFLNHHTTENGFKITVDANMLHHIRRYIDWCSEVEMMGDVFIEQRVDYSVYTPIPNQGGTADHFVCIPPVIDENGKLLGAGELIITDLKMGIGVPVFVERNTQAMLYALGVFLEWNWAYSFGRITIRICQPRLDYFGVWHCSRDELLAFGEEVRVKAAQGWVADAPRTPGPKQCQWCADKSCVAKSALLESFADEVFDDDEDVEAQLMPKDFAAKELDDHAMTPLFGKLLPEKEPRFSQRMSVAVMAWRYSHRKMFEKYFRDIGQELLRLAQAGEHVPLWKVVNGRRKFSWLDPEQAAKELYEEGVPEDKIWISEVTSVAEATKLLREITGGKPKEVEAWLYDGTKNEPGEKSRVRVYPGKPTLAPSDDNRIDLHDQVDEMLDDDDDDDELD